MHGCHNLSTFLFFFLNHGQLLKLVSLFFFVFIDKHVELVKEIVLD